MGSRAPRAGIVSTMRAPGQHMLATWLAYHRAIGFSRFLLYFDDPRDTELAFARDQRDVIAIARDASLMRALRRCSLWSEVGAVATRGQGGDRTMARQRLHVEHALAAIRTRKLPIDWLLHIDHDELLLVPGNDARTQFAALDAAGIEQAIYLNHEAVPETVEVDDVFRDVTLFKRNPHVVTRLRGAAAGRLATHLFVAYARGKAAVRVSTDPVPASVHFFVGRAQPLVTRTLEQPCILHYPSCGFARWQLKYEQLGAFGDAWANGAPIQLAFHLASRDLRTASTARARRYFRARAMLTGPAVRDRLRARGVLVRIRAAGKLLGPRPPTPRHK